MDLVIREHDHGGVPVLSLSGEVDLATVPRLRDRLVKAALDHPGTTVIVDLDGVTLLDSAGLGVLVGGLRRMRATGGNLEVVCTSDRLLEVFAATGLDAVVRVHASLSDAGKVLRRGA
jgi:anti-sigma B factor antagonist